MARTKSDQTEKYTTTEGNIQYKSRQTAMEKFEKSVERIALRCPIGTKDAILAYLEKHPEYKTINEFLNDLLFKELNKD